MLCEKCKEKPANVHLTRRGAVPGAETTDIEHNHHFCEECADQFKRSSPLFNPILDPKRPILIDETSDANPSILTYAGSPGTRTERLRVVDISPDEVWTVLSSRLKGIRGWVSKNRNEPPDFAQNRFVFFVPTLRFHPVFTGEFTPSTFPHSFTRLRPKLVEY